MYKKISSKTIFEHTRITLIEDLVELPDGNRTAYLRFKKTSNAVLIIAKRGDGKILLQREFSYPLDKKIVQFPAGELPLDEDPEIGARRELSEETGYTAKSFKYLGQTALNYRRNDAVEYIFEATDLAEISINHPDPEEVDIEPFWSTDTEIEKMIAKNEIINLHTLAAWSIYKAQRQAPQIERSDSDGYNRLSL